MNGNQKERRKLTRYSLRVPVQFTWRCNGRPLMRGDGLTRDISASGAYVFSTVSPPIDAVLQVEIMLPRPSGKGETRIKGKMVVLRLDSHANVWERTGFAGAALRLLFFAAAPGRAGAGEFSRLSGAS